MWMHACVRASAFYLKALYVKWSLRFLGLDQMVPVQTKVNSSLIFILMPIVPYTPPSPLKEQILIICPFKRTSQIHCCFALNQTKQWSRADAALNLLCNVVASCIIMRNGLMDNYQNYCKICECAYWVCEIWIALPVLKRFSLTGLSQHSEHVPFSQHTNRCYKDTNRYKSGLCSKLRPGDYVL